MSLIPAVNHSWGTVLQRQRLYPSDELQQWKWMLWHSVIGPCCELKLTHFPLVQVVTLQHKIKNQTSSFIDLLIERPRQRTIKKAHSRSQYKSIGKNIIYCAVFSHATSVVSQNINITSKR